MILIASLLISSTIFSQTFNDFNGIPNSEVASEINYMNQRNEAAVAQSQIINVIPTPSTLPCDITFDGEYLWVEGYNNYELYKLSTVDGSVVETIPLDIQRPYGLTFDGENLLVLDNGNKRIQFVNPLDGTVIKETSIENTSEYPTGMTWDGENVWFNDPQGPQPAVEGDETVLLDAQGSIIEEYANLFGYPTGLTFDGTYLWVSDNTTLTISQIDPNTFETIQKIAAPGGAYPNGLAWDGEYLWVSNNQSDSIYQVSVDMPQITDVNTVGANELEISLYPNPVTESVTMNINIDKNTEVNIAIYNSQGQIIKQVVSDNLSMGNHSFTWNCVSDNNSQVSSGIYFCKMVDGANNIVSNKFLVLK